MLLAFMSCDPPINNPENRFYQCDSNCFALNVSGNIINKNTNKGISGMPVTLKWTDSYCFFCFFNTIDTTHSDNEGYYNFDVLIDTTYFRHAFNLSIEIPEDSTYLFHGYPFTKSIGEVPDSSEKVINFELQPAAQLELHLNRIEKDTFQYFYLSYHYIDKVSFGVIEGLRNSEDASNEVYTVPTAADIKTYIVWTKVFNKVKTRKMDSIVCRQNQKNIYELNY